MPHRRQEENNSQHQAWIMVSIEKSDQCSTRSRSTLQSLNPRRTGGGWSATGTSKASPTLFSRVLRLTKRHALALDHVLWRYRTPVLRQFGTSSPPDCPGSLESLRRTTRNGRLNRCQTASSARHVCIVCIRPLTMLLNPTSRQHGRVQ